MDQIRPIKPSEVVTEEESLLPDAVLESFNELIKKNFNGNSATVRQDDVVALMKKKGLNEKVLTEKGWLNVEGIYRKAGWKVRYDKPGFNEIYPPATFTFSLK